MSEGKTSSKRKLRLDLGPDEVEVLLKACKRYRASLPPYLQAKQAEIELVNNLVRKLER